MAELLRPVLGARPVSMVALYILLRMAERRERVIDNEKLAKLLFFALYTEPGPTGEPRLRENPPRLTPEMEFRIYLHGPYIRIRKLVEDVNKLIHSLIGRSDVKGLHEMSGKVIVTAALIDYIDEIIPALRESIADQLGSEYVDMLESWVIEKLSVLPSKQLTTLALRTLHLETEGPPVKKAMVFNMSLDDYIEMLRVLKTIREDLERGRLHPDYELDEVLEEQ